MKYIYISLVTFLFASNAFAHNIYMPHMHQYHYNYNCSSRCLYYGYNFDASTYDHQVDTACVDFCIDKRHTLQRCMRACST